MFENTLPFTFLGLSKEQNTYEKSKCIILPVLYDATVTYKSGTREGAFSIIHASRFLEHFDGEILKNSSEIGIATMPPMCANTDGPEKMIAQLEKVISSILEDDKFPIVVGGEHSLSIAAGYAMKKKHPNVGFLQIDAHLDLRNSYENSEYNHACAMRRVVENGTTVVPVGIRSLCEEEHAYVKQKNIPVFYGWNIKKQKDWIEQVIEKLPPKVYITVDFDGLDPSIMPAVGTPEPGGLLWEEIIELLSEVAKHKTIVGADFVEFCPIPGNISPDFIASKLIYRLIGLL